MSAKNRVFFGKLPYDTRVRDIERWLEDYGFKHIGTVHLKTGYAFVDFDDMRDAEDCVKELDRKDFMGVRITVEFARGPKDHDRFERDDRYSSSGGGRRPHSSNGYFRERYGAPYNTEWRLTVQNLSSRVGWQDMKDFFRQAGRVTFTECHKYKNGEGVVEFTSHEDLKRAIEKLDGEEFMGRKIKLIDESPSGGKRDGYKGRKESRSVSRDRGSRRRRTPRSFSPYKRRPSSDKGSSVGRDRSRSISHDSPRRG